MRRATCALCLAVLTVAPSLIRAQDAVRIPTLLKAARYLEEEGMPEEAAKVRALAERQRAEWKTLLEQKTAELKALQAEVDALRVAIDGGRQVQVDFRILEVSRTHLRQMGFDWKGVFDAPAAQPSQAEAGLPVDQVPGGNGGDAFPRVVEGASKFFDVLELLGRRNIAKLIAEPSVATVDGRKAFVQIGDQAAHDKLMTRVEILPTVADDGSMALDLSVWMRDPLDIGPAGGFDFNNDGPPAPTRELQTVAKLKTGQTVAAGVRIVRKVGAMDADANGKRQFDEIEYLILATPKLVDLPVVATAPTGEGKAAEGSQR